MKWRDTKENRQVATLFLHSFRKWQFPGCHHTLGIVSENNKTDETDSGQG